MDSLMRGLLDAVKDFVQAEIAKLSLDDSEYGVWQSTEGGDANLSVVQVRGVTIRGIPKHAHVTGLTFGDVVELVHAKGSTKPLTIVGKMSGNISLT